MAAHLSWAATSDPTARTAPGRKAFEERFYNLVDPDRVLPEAERERRAKHARKAYFLDLNLRAQEAKRRKRDATEDETLRAEIAALSFVSEDPQPVNCDSPAPAEAVE